MIKSRRRRGRNANFQANLELEECCDNLVSHAKKTTASLPIWSAYRINSLRLKPEQGTTDSRNVRNKDWVTFEL